MVKLKSGLLSLEAHNTLGGVITFQKRSGVTFARRKPTPTDPRTLPQLYQRWLYQDYIAWWHAQSAATKQTWETNARPYHMTGFAYWMKYNLTNLPDIGGLWHLDERTGTTAKDFSRNGYDGTITGALHRPGYLDYGLWFDGLDDKVACGECLDARGTTFTIKATIKANTYAPQKNFISNQGVTFFFTVNTLRCYFNGGDRAISGVVLTNGSWHRVGVTYDLVRCKVFVDGVKVKDSAYSTAVTYGGTLNFPSAPILLGYLDEVDIRTRAQSEDEMETDYARLAWAAPRY